MIHINIDLNKYGFEYMRKDIRQIYEENSDLLEYSEEHYGLSHLDEIDYIYLYIKEKFPNEKKQTVLILFKTELVISLHTLLKDKVNFKIKYKDKEYSIEYITTILALTSYENSIDNYNMQLGNYLLTLNKINNHSILSILIKDSNSNHEK